MTGPGHAGAPSAGSALFVFAEQWVSSLAWTSYVPMTRVERHSTLLGFTERLAAALVAEPFVPQVGYDVGAELVRADFAAPEALGATVQFLGENLRDAVGVGQWSEARSRTARLLGALTTGYTWALRDRTLDEQEAIRAAALVAREQADDALRRSEARFRHAALHDLLTGLPNRALFAERLDQIFRQAAPGMRIGLCFIDLDAFKVVNDSLGHHVGDKLLVAVAERLNGLAAESSQVAARFGGDEFVLLVEGSAGTEDAVKTADRAMALFAEPFHVDGHDLSMTASIGIVERAIDETDTTELLRAADMTLHWAKTDGKARWTVFDQERNIREVARYTLAAAMPGALDRGEFILHYQPIVGLARGTLDGVEALARWEHPDLGLLKPDRFIALAEDSGLIVPLGLYLMEQACRQAAEWQVIDPQRPFVSVNLAVRQIRQPRLISDVAAVLDRTGLPPHKLQLEITESAVMGDDPETVVRLRDLAGLGVRLAIDDFGTGYSNLAYLRNLPVHTLKLAGQFVDDLRHPRRSVLPSGNPVPGATQEAALLRILVTLSHTLGLSVTAEGIETLEQAEILKGIGCETGQGFYLGYPTRPDDITELLRHPSAGGTPALC
jgi:diguanylate cyclase (GGDEF)-like protein